MLHPIPDETGRTIKEILSNPYANPVIREHANFLLSNKGESTGDFIFHEFTETGATLWHDLQFSSTVTVYPEYVHNDEGNSLPSYRKPQCRFSYELREKIAQVISETFLSTVAEKYRARLAWWLQFRASETYIKSIPDRAWSVKLTDDQKLQVVITVTRYLINEHGIENLLKQLENQ